MNKSGGAIAITGILTLIFITLKLLGARDWNWPTVLAPCLIGLLSELVYAAYRRCRMSKMRR